MRVCYSIPSFKVNLNHKQILLSESEAFKTKRQREEGRKWEHEYDWVTSTRWHCKILYLLLVLLASLFSFSFFFWLLQVHIQNISPAKVLLLNSEFQTWSLSQNSSQQAVCKPSILIIECLSQLTVFLNRFEVECIHTYPARACWSSKYRKRSNDTLVTT